MESNIWQKQPLERWRIIALILNYFLGFLVVYPLLLRTITLWIDPYAKTIPGWLQFCAYFLMIIISLYVGWPLLQESYQRFKERKKSFIKIILSLLGLFYVSTILLNVIIMLLSQTTTSANQLDVVSTIETNPYLMIFSTCIYAPIVEEMLFRGVFFRGIRGRTTFLVAALVSAFSFGFIHVMDSLLSGNFNDLWYILSYALIGFFLSLAYEKSESIFGSICLHILNNALAFLLFLL